MRTLIRNVPLPEPFLIGMAAAGVLHVLRPWRLPTRGLRALGSALTAGGVGLAAWSVAASRNVELSRPDGLVQSGPYAHTRNPMYLGWALIHLGIALSTRSVWMLGTLPVAAAVVHRQVLQEERMLEETLPLAYERYRAEVPRYLPGATVERLSAAARARLRHASEPR